MNTLSRRRAGGVAVPSGRSAGNWVSLILLIAAILWIFRSTAAGMVEIWWRSETFQHAFLVVPICVWLIWRRRADLARLSARPGPWALVPMLLACLLWLAGELAGVNAASQFGLVAMLVLTVPALFGWAVTRALAFPLAFLFFAVPFGEFAVPTLQLWTADMTVFALRASGVPLYREGMQFVIPSGNWSVVEACSGIRYQIACLMVGSLFAYLNYRSTTKRIGFLLLSLVVPVLANWLRAYSIVYISHVTGSTYLMGVGHQTYGWFIFGAVVGLMFYAGAKWADPEVVPEPPRATASRELAPASFPFPVWGVAIAVLALLVGTHSLLSRLEGRTDPRAVMLTLPGVAVPEDEFPFTPGWVGPAATAAARLETNGPPVWLWVGYYGPSGDGAELVSSVNEAAKRKDRRWTTATRGSLDLPLNGSASRVQSVDLRSDVPMTAVGEQRLRVLHFYWVDGRFDAGDARVKLLQAFSRLNGQGGDGAVVMLATPVDADTDTRLQQAFAAQGTAIRQALAAARQAR